MYMEHSHQNDEASRLANLILVRLIFIRRFKFNADY